MHNHCPRVGKPVGLCVPAAGCPQLCPGQRSAPARRRVLSGPRWTLTCRWVFALQQKKSYLERSVKEAEDNIREMLMARRAQ